MASCPGAGLLWPANTTYQPLVNDGTRRRTVGIIASFFLTDGSGCSQPTTSEIDFAAAASSSSMRTEVSRVHVRDAVERLTGAAPYGARPSPGRPLSSSIPSKKKPAAAEAEAGQSKGGNERSLSRRGARECDRAHMNRGLSAPAQAIPSAMPRTALCLRRHRASVGVCPADGWPEPPSPSRSVNSTPRVKIRQVRHGHGASSKVAGSDSALRMTPPHCWAPALTQVSGQLSRSHKSRVSASSRQPRQHAAP
jgi:hypothetical protein